MKTRIGFVSNSSSSSFIIAAKNPDNLKATIQIDVNLSDFESIYRSRITTVEQLKNYYIDDYCYEETELAENEYYQSCVKAIERGETIIFLTFSSDECGVESAIHEMGSLGKISSKFNNITVIQGESE